MNRVNIKGLMVIVIAIAVGVASPAVAQQACPPAEPLPPAFPTNIDINLLNLNGSNIDTSLLLTIDFFDADGCPVSWNSVDNAGDGTGDTVFWGIYNGKSNLYTNPPAKNGTNINITVEGYEMLVIGGPSPIPPEPDYYLTPLDTPPPDVTTTVVQRMDYYFNITWTIPSDPDLKEFNIYQRLNDNPSTDTLIDTIPPNYTQPYIAGHGYDDGNLYQYKVTAVDNAGNEGNGTYAPDGPVPPIPSAPLGTLLTLSSGLVAYGYYRRKIKILEDFEKPPIPQN